MYEIELAAKIRRGRVVGNLYVVTQSPIGLGTILAQFNTREEAQAWIAEQDKQDRQAFHAYCLACDDEGLNPHTMRMWKIHGKPTGPI